MKGIMIILISSLFLISCATVNVTTDFDTSKDFTNFKSFAFFKPGIDEVEISDLDKRRILRAIDTVMQSKGFVKTETPDLLVNISTDAEKNTYFYQNNFGWGWGWSPFWWGPGFMNSYDVIEGTLFIDLIDAKNKELVWQGIGKAPLVDGPYKKEERIREIVASVLAKYPPMKK